MTSELTYEVFPAQRRYSFYFETMLPKIDLTKIDSNKKHSFRETQTFRVMGFETESGFNFFPTRGIFVIQPSITTQYHIVSY